MDVKNAYLNAKLSEEIFMELPPGFTTPECKNLVCCLLMALYGPDDFGMPESMKCLLNSDSHDANPRTVYSIEELHTISSSLLLWWMTLPLPLIPQLFSTRPSCNSSQNSP